MGNFTAMIKAIIFDYDETLTQTLAAKSRAYIDFARVEYHLAITEAAIKQAYGQPYEKFIFSLFGSVEPVDQIISKYQKFSQNYHPLAYENAETVVNRLFKKYLVGIVSGIRRSALLSDLQHLKFDQKYFFHLQCGDDTAILKPDLRVFDPLMVKLKLAHINPEEVMSVGDSLGDYQVSVAAGFRFIGIAHHTTSEAEFAQAKANFITNFSNLEQSILQI